MDESLCFLKGEHIWSHQCYIQLLYQFLTWMIQFCHRLFFYTYILNALFKGCGKARDMILVWCCVNSGSFSIWISRGDINQFTYIEFQWMLFLALGHILRGAVSMIWDLPVHFQYYLSKNWFWSYSIIHVFVKYFIRSIKHGLYCIDMIIIFNDLWWIFIIILFNY